MWPRAGSLGENGCAWLPGPVPSHTNSVSTLLSSCRGPREMKPRLQLSGLCSVVQRRDAATRTDGGVAATPQKSEMKSMKHDGTSAWTTVTDVRRQELVSKTEP